MRPYLRVAAVILACGLALFQLWNMLCSEARESGGQWSLSLVDEPK